MNIVRTIGIEWIKTVIKGTIIQGIIAKNIKIMNQIMIRRDLLIKAQATTGIRIKIITNRILVRIETMTIINDKDHKVITWIQVQIMTTIKNTDKIEIKLVIEIHNKNQ